MQSRSEQDAAVEWHDAGDPDSSLRDGCDSLKRGVILVVGECRDGERTVHRCRWEVRQTARG